MLFVPVVADINELLPTAMLFVPLVFDTNKLLPTAILLIPVLDESKLLPMTIELPSIVPNRAP